MNRERLQLKGMLGELEREAKLLDAKCKGSVILIRNILNPYEDDVCKLDTEVAKTTMIELHKSKLELKEIRAKIQRIREDLE